MKYFKSTINGKTTLYALFDDNDIVYEIVECVEKEKDDYGNEYETVIFKRVMKEGFVEITKEEYDSFIAQREQERLNRRKTISAVEKEINELKAFLDDSDKKAIKHSEGWYTDEEYAPIREARQKARDRINELEASNSL